VAPAQSSLSDLQAVRAALPRPVAVGRFVAAPGLEPWRDRRLPVRAMAIRPPRGSTFSAYIEAYLSDVLRTSGRLSAQSPVAISGRLVENHVSAGFGSGRVVLAVEFIVSRDGAERWRGVERVEERWDPSVLGAIALEQAQARYGALYGRLIQALLANPQFRNAAAAGGG
jgi:hypothetical protein